MNKSKQNKAKLFTIFFLLIVLSFLFIIGGIVVYIDPYFHYHKPYTDKFFYSMNSQVDFQMSQNIGIIKSFDYDALITGTSMTENFKTSEADKIFGINSIKVPVSGGSLLDINENVMVALEENENMKLVIRGIDMSKFFLPKNTRRDDVESFPEYLYDDFYFNDVKYLFNKRIVFDSVLPMIWNKEKKHGITSFDEYSNWMHYNYKFGKNAIYSRGISPTNKMGGDVRHLSMQDEQSIRDTIRQNVSTAPEEYPNVTFIYFFPPYSVAWWKEKIIDGEFYKYIEAEKVVIEELLKYDNVKLFSFNTVEKITTDLNNYKDNIHYGEWINSLILKYMGDNKYQLTEDNYLEYLKKEFDLYNNYNYASLNDQIDYDNDYYIAALWNKEISGVEPKGILFYPEIFKLDNASLDNVNGDRVLECEGSLKRTNRDSNVEDYILNNEFIGIKVDNIDLSQYQYLVYYGKKDKGYGSLGVYIYNGDGDLLTKSETEYYEIDNEWHQYLIDVSEFNEIATIIFNGGYTEYIKEESKASFKNITLY